MIAKMTTNGANCMSMSFAPPRGDEELVWAKAWEMNTGGTSSEGAIGRAVPLEGP